MESLKSSINKIHKPLVSFSIISHEQGHFVNRLLQSLAQFHSQLKIEVLLTENIQEDIVIQELGLPFPVHKFKPEQPRGFAANHNAALKNAKGEFFVLMNPDVTLHEDVLSPLLEHLQSNRADVVAPLILDPDGRLQDTYRKLPTPSSLFLRTIFPSFRKPEPLKGKYLEPDWLAGIFLMTKSEIYHQLGGLNESYFLYFEDVDFCTRVRLAGMKILLDTTCSIIHEAQRASHRQLRHLLWHLRSAFRFFTSETYIEARRAQWSIR